MDVIGPPSKLILLVLGAFISLNFVNRSMAKKHVDNFSKVSSALTLQSLQGYDEHGEVHAGVSSPAGSCRTKRCGQAYCWVDYQNKITFLQMRKDL